MKKFYYFSKTKLKYVEIKDFNKKAILYLSIAVFTVSSILFGSYFGYNYFLNSDKTLKELRVENKVLTEKLKSALSKYEVLRNDLAQLSETNNELRIAANLRPLTEEERLLGTGGISINFLNLFSDYSRINLYEVDEYLNKVSLELEFEKVNYYDITNKLNKNDKLFESIPAIKPANGRLALNGFGNRHHPILRVRQMHDGVDIITDVGTPVYATGAGRIDFAGRRTGYGLTIEIDHGFGYRTIYAHLSKISVKEGQKITRGDLIAKSGNTGLSSGPHVHYEVHHNGIKLDPEDFFFDDFGLFEILTANQ